MTLDFRNTNTLWGSVLVETLVRLGLTTAVISPGSRSTPLTVALARHPQVEAIPILDERSAAFLGLGLAKRSGTPVVLVCTSGTAGANYYPAVIEARESRVPLLLLTADRPPELRDCTSGQTVDQQKLFGDFPNWYAELATPEPSLPLLRYLRQTLVQAWQRSLSPVAGPVHLNCPFRDPLAPVADASVAALQAQIEIDWFESVRSPVSPTPTLARPCLEELLATWRGCDRGLIIAGPAQPVDPDAYRAAVTTLAQILQWPVLAEALSPLRHTASRCPQLITTYDLLLRHRDQAAALIPHQVIQLGPLPTSKVLRQWLECTQPRRWIIDPAPRNLDPLHGPTTLVPVTVAALAEQLEVGELSPPVGDYRQTWLSLEHCTRQRLNRAMARITALAEPKLPWHLAQILPPATPLVVANSMPIRDLEWFCPPQDRGIQPYCNRGANGIDGTLSMALGIAHRHRPTVLLTGDLALLHDTNGWLAIPQFQGHLTVVVVNNQGGGIFEMLPIAAYNPPFETYFATPQTVDLARLAAAYGVEYGRLSAWEELTAALSQLPATGVRLLEFPSHRSDAHRCRQSLLQSLGHGLLGDGQTEDPYYSDPRP